MTIDFFFKCRKNIEKYRSFKSDIFNIYLWRMYGGKLVKIWEISGTNIEKWYLCQRSEISGTNMRNIWDKYWEISGINIEKWNLCQISEISGTNMRNIWDKYWEVISVPIWVKCQEKWEPFNSLHYASYYLLRIDSIWFPFSILYIF